MTQQPKASSRCRPSCCESPWAVLSSYWTTARRAGMLRIQHPQIRFSTVSLQTLKPKASQRTTVVARYCHRLEFAHAADQVRARQRGLLRRRQRLLAVRGRATLQRFLRLLHGGLLEAFGTQQALGSAQAGKVAPGHIDWDKDYVCLILQHLRANSRVSPVLAMDMAQVLCDFNRFVHHLGQRVMSGQASLAHWASQLLRLMPAPKADVAAAIVRRAAVLIRTSS